MFGKYFIISLMCASFAHAGKPNLFKEAGTLAALVTQTRERIENCIIKAVPATAAEPAPLVADQAIVEASVPSAPHTATLEDDAILTSLGKLPHDQQRALYNQVSQFLYAMIRRGRELTGLLRVSRGEWRGDPDYYAQQAKEHENPSLPPEIVAASSTPVTSNASAEDEDESIVVQHQLRQFEMRRNLALSEKKLWQGTTRKMRDAFVAQLANLNEMSNIFRLEKEGGLARYCNQFYEGDASIARLPNVPKTGEEMRRKLQRAIQPMLEALEQRWLPHFERLKAGAAGELEALEETLQQWEEECEVTQEYINRFTNWQAVDRLFKKRDNVVLPETVSSPYYLLTEPNILGLLTRKQAENPEESPAFFKLHDKLSAFLNRFYEIIWPDQSPASRSRFQMELSMGGGDETSDVAADSDDNSSPPSTFD